MDMLAGGTIRVSVGSLVKGAIGSLFRKAKGAPATAAVAFDGGRGRPLDGGTASRMGTAFGRDFGGVRVHTGDDAASAAAQLNARAFTVGNDVAFAAGEYAPGTLVGDALLAHELAHVAQQEGAQTFDAKGAGPESDVEDDADTAALYAVASLWPAVRRFGVQLRQNAMPRLKSSLQLSRCSAKPSELQDYMRDRDRTNAVEDHNDSDDKARQIVEEWSKGDTQYVLTVRRKIVLIKELMTGHFSGRDQKGVLNLLERSESADLEQMLGPQGIPHETLLSKFDSYKKELWRFYMRRYPDAYPDDVKQAALFGDEAPEPQAPDLAKLKTATPLEWPHAVPQFGDELPETTQGKQVQTKAKLNKLSKDEASDWVKSVYGNYISKEQIEKVGKTSVTYEQPQTVEFESFLNACMATKPRHTKAEKDKAEGECRAEEPSTAAFQQRSDNSITVRTDREDASTMIHEVLHAFADPRTEELGRFAKEGLTEFLTRRVALRHAQQKKEPHLYIGAHYDRPYDAIQELAIAVGENLLAQVHFQGAVTKLCNTLGKAKFDAWNEAMESQAGNEDATDILRGKKEVKPTKEKCT
jgi:hypothetical protein